MYVHVLFEMFHTNLKHAFLPTYLSPFHLVSKDYLLLLQCLNFANTSASFVLWIVTERSHVQVHLAVYFVACFINCFTCVICTSYPWYYLNSKITSTQWHMFIPPGLESSYSVRLILEHVPKLTQKVLRLHLFSTCVLFLFTKIIFQVAIVLCVRIALV